MPDPTRRPRPTAAHETDEGIQWKRWVLGIVIVLLLIVIAQNAQSVRFKFLFIADFKAPLVLLLLGAALIGAGVGYMLPILSRHRRQVSREAGTD